MKPSSKPSAVYIHIPFCQHKCYYCDFNTYALQGQPVDRYLEALEREIERTVTAIPPHLIETIYVGGGTPTALQPRQMERLLQMIERYLPLVGEQLEFTMEANPGTTDDEKLAVMKEGGVNRLSFGVQSFNNDLLKTIGRIHQTDEIYRSIALAKQLGFANISIDLMFGLPNQTLQHVADSLTAALDLDLQHYSVYGLIIEEQTLFHQMYMKNELPLPDQDEEVAMFELIIERLQQAGYEHYEISNFARPGFTGKHNEKYWHNEYYYGFGAGAHGYVNGYRHVNIKGVEPYIAATVSGLPILERTEVTEREAMEDFMMVGMRLLQGVSNERFREQFGIDMVDVFGEALQRLLAQELIEKNGDRYKLSATGILFGNEVFGAFI